MEKKYMTILSPTGLLGYGFPVESFNRGLEENPDFIGVDAGSVDPGPYYLGAGKSFTGRSGVKRDLRLMLEAAISRKIPLIIGSAGGAGAKPHLEWCKNIIEEIAQEQGLSFKMGLIYADIDPAYLRKAVRAGRTEPLEWLEPLDEDTVDESTAIVAQMGTGPFKEALEKGCDVVLAGRAYDPAVFSALPELNGFDRGLSLHLGKILECAAIAAEPGSGSDCALGTLYEGSFILKALSDERRFTRYSTAAHTLYEKSDPYKLPGPDGVLDLTDVTFSEKVGGVVEVRGSRFIPASENVIKVEGVRRAGYRTVSIAGVRDPIMIGQIDSIIETINQRIDEFIKAEKINAKVSFKLYGKNGVMGTFEPEPPANPHEVGIIIDALAKSQENADAVCAYARSSLLHYGYPDRLATAGNLAFPFSPSDISAGEVYEFSIYHLLKTGDDTVFPVHIVEIKGGRS